tara:strand:+ start:477 stop:785 length:309 start_codon:yes stop_codon:yes gene_type:complete
LASGDVFSETNGTFPAATLVSIRPAVGVQVVITNTFAEDTLTQFWAGSTVGLTFFPDATGNSNSWNNLGSGNIKLLLTNDEYINIYNAGGGDRTYGYTGMEI